MLHSDEAFKGLEAWLTRLVAKELKTEPDRVSAHQELTDMGLDSMSAVTVVGDIELELGVEIDTSTLWEYPTIAKLAEFLEQEGCKAPQDAAL
jgi:acyl carrier protein